MANKATAIIKSIDSGRYDAVFSGLYIDNTIIAEENERYKKAIEEFISLYGDLDIEIYSAPGRSEICGNHTDHQCGKVLATSVNIDVIAIVSPTNDNIVHFKSEGYPADEVDISNLLIDQQLFGTTAALIRGVAAGFAKREHSIGGFKAYATSQVLPGSGLSSSAAIEILIGQIFSGLYNSGQIDDITLAIIGQEAENKYFGKPSGLMDQMACSVGGLIHIDFKVPSQPIVNRVDIDFEVFNHSLCIVDTKGSHVDLTDDYAKIPEEMSTVAKYFGKSVLREINEEDFYREITLIRKYAGDRSVLRAIHFFDENKRVDEQMSALSGGSFEDFRQLVRESGNSSYRFLQNVYSAKRSEDQSIPLGLIMTKKLLGKECACRVHGGGFAGTIQVFVPNEKIDMYKEKIEELFGRGSCYVLRIRTTGGCKVL